MLHPWDPQHFTSFARTIGRPEPVIGAALATAATIKSRHPDLPVIFTLHHLGHMVGVDPQLLWTYAARTAGNNVYRTFLLEKRRPPSEDRSPDRAYREISIPEPKLMLTQRWIAQNILKPISPHPASFAFHKDGGVKRAAERHAGCTWLIKLDVSQFFDSLTERHAYRVFRSLGYSPLLSLQMARICTRIGPDARPSQVTRYGVEDLFSRHLGQLPQGAPTSPALANLSVVDLDRKLTRMASSIGWVYTRYADDLAFSTKGKSSRSEARSLVARVKSLLRSHGLEPNAAKTVIAPPGARRIVLGLQVDGPKPRLTQAFRNNLETHLYALTRSTIGPDVHRRTRGFSSIVGMRRHICGLLAYAHYIEPQYAEGQYARWNTVAWPAEATVTSDIV